MTADVSAGVLKTMTEEELSSKGELSRERPSLSANMRARDFVKNLNSRGTGSRLQETQMQDYDEATLSPKGVEPA